MLLRDPRSCLPRIRFPRHHKCPHSLLEMALQEEEAWMDSNRLQQQEAIPVVISALKACSVLRDLEFGKAIHARSISSRYGSSSIRVASSLINMYAKCGSMMDASAVFRAMPSVRDVVSWSVLLSGYAENGEMDLAFTLFSSMQQEGCAPNERTFTSVLKACTGLASREPGQELYGRVCKVKSLKKGKGLHLQAAHCGFEADAFVSSSLVEMYAKCGSIVDAERVFKRIVFPDVVSWTVLMLGYIENEMEELALELFWSIKEKDAVAPNAWTYSAAAKACTRLAAKEDGTNVDGKVVKLASLNRGMVVHCDAVKCGCSSEIFFMSSLVDMYGKCGSLLDARMVFDRIRSSNVVTWNSLILGYAENNEEKMAVAVFMGMQGFCDPDSRTFVSAAKACSKLAVKEVATEVDGKWMKAAAWERGLEVHAQAVNCKCEKDAFVGSAFVEMFSQCGSLVDAWRTYEEMHSHDVVSWTVVVLAHAENGEEKRALEIFESMKPEGCKPDSGAFIAAFKACSRLAEKEPCGNWSNRHLKLRALEKTMAIHSQAPSHHYSDILFGNTLMDTYAKCGSLDDARKVFDRMAFHNVVSWTILMVGCVENENGDMAFKLFLSMGTLPDAQAFVAVLGACISLAEEESAKHYDEERGVKLSILEKGMLIHSQVTNETCEADIFVSNTLIELYSRCGTMHDARNVFDRMLQHNLVSWNALVLGYAENGEEALALDLYFELLRVEDLWPPDKQAFAAALKACSSLAALEKGRRIHADICRHGNESDAVIVASLVDFYGKCGNTNSSRQIFNSNSGKDLVRWNSLIASYSRQGDAREVLELFHEMLDEDLEADAITFISLLTACSHAGMVNRGCRYFENMLSKYRVPPTVDHYHCMIDLLGRADRQEEAVAMVRNMPFEPSPLTWRTLLGACGKGTDSRNGLLALRSLRCFARGSPVEERKLIPR